jgi:co-chaperonin GroES (HSP10)
MPNTGVRLGNETLTCVQKHEKIRPLRDQIVVEPLPVNETIIVTGFRPVRGKVLAVGPGIYPKRYDGRKGQRTKSWDSKAFRPCDVKVGDIVELGGFEIEGYLHMTVRWGKTDVIICREEDVAGIVTREDLCLKQNVRTRNQKRA